MTFSINLGETNFSMEPCFEMDISAEEVKEIVNTELGANLVQRMSSEAAKQIFTSIFPGKQAKPSKQPEPVKAAHVADKADEQEDDVIDLGGIKIGNIKGTIACMQHEIDKSKRAIEHELMQASSTGWVNNDITLLTNKIMNAVNDIVVTREQIRRLELLL